MNNINFQQSVGFPLETDILNAMQTAYTLFNALGHIAGEKSILSGCVTVGQNVTDGVIFLNGEVLEFRGGFVQTTIVIQEEITSLEFEDGTFKEVVKVRFATFGVASTSYLWADFKRAYPTNIIKEIKDKIDGIASGAEVNVQANWTQADNTQDDFIKNKPTGTLLTYLRKAVYLFPTPIVGTDVRETISFPTIGTANYMVLGSFITNGGSQNEPKPSWSIKNRTATSFQLLLPDINNTNEQLSFSYVIIAL